MGMGHNKNDQVVIMKMTDPVQVSKVRQTHYLFKFFFPLHTKCVNSSVHSRTHVVPPSQTRSILFSQNVGRGHNENNREGIMKMTDPVPVSKVRQTHQFLNFFFVPLHPKCVNSSVHSRTHVVPPLINEVNFVFSKRGKGSQRK